MARRIVITTRTSVTTSDTIAITITDDTFEQFLDVASRRGISPCQALLLALRGFIAATRSTPRQAPETKTQ